MTMSGDDTSTEGATSRSITGADATAGSTVGSHSKSYITLATTCSVPSKVSPSH